MGVLGSESRSEGLRRPSLRATRIHTAIGGLGEEHWIKICQNGGGQMQDDSCLNISGPYKTLTLDVTYFENQE